MNQAPIQARADYLNHDGHVRTRTYLGHTLDFHKSAIPSGSRLLDSLAVNHLAPGGVEHGLFNQRSGIEHPVESEKMDKSDNKMYWLTKLSLTGHPDEIRKIKDDMRENPLHGFYSVSKGEDMWERAKQAVQTHEGGRLMPVWLKEKAPRFPSSEYNDLQAVTTASSTNQHKTVPVKTSHPSAGKYKDNRKNILKKIGKR